jgi:hypothetical protein
MKRNSRTRIVAKEKQKNWKMISRLKVLMENETSN